MDRTRYLHNLGKWEGSEWWLIKNEFNNYKLREIKLTDVGDYFEPSEFTDHTMSYVAYLLSEHKE